RAGVAPDEGAIDDGAASGSLNGGDTGSDVERQGGVVLQHGAPLEASSDALPGIAGRSARGVNRAIDDKAMPLIVITAAVVPPDVEEVDGRTEEEFAHVVERLGPGIGDAIVAPLHRALNEGDVQPVVARIGQRLVLAVVGVVRIGAAAIVCS